MKIGFVNFSPLEYDVDTPYHQPLGGTESSMCYLAPELAKLGHKVILFGRYQTNFTKKGVIHKNQEKIDTDLDFLIVQTHPLPGQAVKAKLGPKTKLVLWEHMDTDQPPVVALAQIGVRSAFDYFIFVSEWQKEKYIRTFGIDRRKCLILRNAISPTFQDLISKKSSPPVLVYTSTPFRGLNVLIKTFPLIRQQVPDIRLKVFSSIKVYQQDDKDKYYEELYQICRQTKGVEYIGSVNQKRLARELVKASVLAYPNTFPETSCITALEAMAAGCQVVSSFLGAIPETTAGFARLISIGDDKEQYCQDFIKTVVDVLQKPNQDNLKRQQIFINHTYTWKKRACEWDLWLEKML